MLSDWWNTKGGNKIRVRYLQECVGKCKKCINKKHWNDVIFTDGGWNRNVYQATQTWNKCKQKRVSKVWFHWKYFDFKGVVYYKDIHQLGGAYNIICPGINGQGAFFRIFTFAISDQLYILTFWKEQLDLHFQGPIFNEFLMRVHIELCFGEFFFLQQDKLRSDLIILWMV